MHDTTIQYPDHPLDHCSIVVSNLQGLLNIHAVYLHANAIDATLLAHL
jgi:hypothetical protein